MAGAALRRRVYNQANLAPAYPESVALTGDWFHARVARQTLDYVLRDMTSAEGAFYSATDADSEGEEGLFFLWTPASIRAALQPDEAELALDLFQVNERGNFEGKSILNLPVPLDVYPGRGSLTGASCCVAWTPSARSSTPFANAACTPCATRRCSRRGTR